LGKHRVVAAGGTSISLTLIAIGGILRWAVTAHVSWLDIQTVGLILIIVGVIGFVVSMLELFLWAPRRAAREPTRYPRDYDATHRLS
jgi:phosphate/sulfate permease